MQAFGDRQRPLAHWQMGEDVVDQMGGGLGHAPGVARWANAAAFAGEGHQKGMPAVITARACKAVGKDCALQILLKSFLHVGRRGVVVALAVERAGAGQIKPGLEVFGNRAVQQGLVGVARVVGFGGLRL